MVTKKQNKIIYYVGASTIIVTHLYMLFIGMKPEEVVPHALINLSAIGLVAYSYFTKK